MHQPEKNKLEISGCESGKDHLNSVPTVDRWRSGGPKKWIDLSKIIQLISVKVAVGSWDFSLLSRVLLPTITHDCNTKLVPVTCLFKKMIGYTVFIHLTLFGSINANYMFVMEY